MSQFVEGLGIYPYMQRAGMKRVFIQEENADLRGLEQGGWFRIENELQIVFEPLVGYKACWLYAVLCRVIPLAQRLLAEGTRLKLTQDYLASQSGLSQSSVQRELDTLVAIGMVIRHQPSMKRCATFRLVNLRRLADLGADELKARLGDPHRVTEHGASIASPETGQRMEAATRPAIRADREASPLHVAEDLLEALEEVVDPRYPHRVTGNDVVETRKFAADTEHSGSPVTRKQGSGDPRAGLFIKEKDLRKSTPPNPRPGGEVSEAVAKVMRECSLSEPRLENPIQRALVREASRSDETPNWNAIAESMIASHKRYAELGRQGLMRFPVKVRRFFGEGIWRDEGLWNIDRDVERRMSQARIGAP